MSLLKFISVALLILVAPSFAISQEFELRNKIDLNVTAQVGVELVAKEYIYSYILSSSYKSQQNVWQFEVILQGEDLIKSIQGPQGWYKPTIKPIGLGVSPQLANVVIAHWGSPNSARVAPGTSVSGFKLVSSSLPGIGDYYAEGYAPAPWFPAGSAPEGDIPGYDDLTPYGPGVVGKTIVPVEPPAIFNPLNFLNHIINLKNEAFKIGWITNQGIEQSLDAKLESAKKKLDAGDIKAVKNILNAFLNEVEAQKDKHLTSEAYGLLKYNTQYIVERL